VAQLLATGAGQDGEPERKRPRPPTSSPISSPSSSSSSSSSPQPPMPSTLGSPSPLFEARRLIAFVGPYILPSNFAVPDFRFLLCPHSLRVCRVCRVSCVVGRVVRAKCTLLRYPVMGCTFESVFGLGPPTIVFANTEFCKLTEFRLVGQPQPNPLCSRWFLGVLVVVVVVQIPKRAPVTDRSIHTRTARAAGRPNHKSEGDWREFAPAHVRPSDQQVRC
jgi:hypothetical protein